MNYSIPKAPSPESIRPMQVGRRALRRPRGSQARRQPAPTHEQVVAVMRYCQAIQDEIDGLLPDPDLGKSDMKPRVIEAAEKLVAAGIFTTADAAALLADFPDVPEEQSSWLRKHQSMATAAMGQVLDDHGAAVALGLVPADGVPNPARHIEDIRELLAHYSRS